MLDPVLNVPLKELPYKEIFHQTEEQLNHLFIKKWPNFSNRLFIMIA